jgi:methanogenic corrinoid protein MtbC1
MPESSHPIRVAAARSGLTPDVLRAWEKRYSAVHPLRKDGRRLYGEEDIQRLILLRRATLAGRRIGDVASLTTDALRQLEEADRLAMAEVPGTARVPRSAATRPALSAEPETYRAACLKAVMAFDEKELNAALEQASVALGQVRLLDDVILPVMQDVGEMWRQGNMRVAQEHLATEILQSFLTELRKSHTSDSAAPRIVITTLPGQYHELGALVVAATAASEGWNVTYLGPNLPTEEIAAAVLSLKARAVALSLIYPSDDPRMGTQIESLRRHIGEGIVLIIGGAASTNHEDSIKASNAIYLREMASLRALLTTLRMQTSTRK